MTLTQFLVFMVVYIVISTIFYLYGKITFTLNGQLLVYAKIRD